MAAAAPKRGRSVPETALGLFNIFAPPKRARPTTAQPASDSIEVLAVSDSETEPGVGGRAVAGSLEESHPGGEVDCRAEPAHAASPCTEKGGLEETVASGEADCGAESAHAASPRAATADFLDSFRFAESPPTGTPCAREPVDIYTPPPLARGRCPAAPRQPRKRAEEEAEDFAALTPEDRARILEKWRGLAGPAPDRNATRVRMLVAAILCSKTSEVVVRSHMQKLQAWADEEGGPGLTAEHLAGIEPQALEDMLEGVHWHKVKASRILKAVAAVIEHWSGCVPPAQKDLITLPGIGPKLAALLAFVFEADLAAPS